MKTPVFFLFIGLLLSLSISAQTKLNFKADSLFFKKDTFHSQLNLKNPFRNEKPRSLLPNSRYFQPNSNLAVIPDKKQPVFSDPNFRMPLWKPDFQSNMPVMKPDSSVTYFLKIKKIGKPDALRRLK